jgi:hypothetical protein
VAKEQPQTTDEVSGSNDESIRCVSCGHRLSEQAYRIAQSGAHEHTFVNPGGVVYRIACFAAAPGCAHVGGTEQAFTWFPGWKWQVAICSRCHTHVGWIFRCVHDQFHGLILSALR